jgi:hypothetical protein
MHYIYVMPPSLAALDAKVRDLAEQNLFQPASSR